MKILQLIPTYKPAYIYGGPVFSTSLLCENLAKEGHEVRMLSTTANGPEELPVQPGSTHDVDGVTVTYYRRYTKDHTHLAPGLMWEVFTQCKKYDVVHFHAWWNIPVMTSVFLCWLRGVKPVFSPRGTLSNFSFEKNHSSGKALFHRFIGKFLLSKTCFHVTAASERQEIEGLSKDFFELPNFIKLANGSLKTVEPRAQSSVFNLLFLSRVHPKKNLEGMIEALSTVDFDFEFKIVGPGKAEYVQQLKNLAEAKGIAEKISWIGPVHGEEKFRLYAEADLFVLPSFNENFANVVIEALSAGTPVMISEKVGLEDYVRKNNLGWVCTTEPQNVAEMLTDIFSKKGELSAIGKAAREVVTEDFSPKKLTQRYVEQYQALRKK